MTTDLYGTDVGPACKCGGTAYEYRTSDLAGIITATCVTCKRARVLYMNVNTVLTAKTIREHHVRANRVGV